MGAPDLPALWPKKRIRLDLPVTAPVIGSSGITLLCEHALDDRHHVFRGRHQRPKRGNSLRQKLPPAVDIRETHGALYTIVRENMRRIDGVIKRFVRSHQLTISFRFRPFVGAVFPFGNMVIIMILMDGKDSASGVD